MGNAVAAVDTKDLRPQRAQELFFRTPARQRGLFVSPELNDLIKVGGLGDVAASLPRALSRYYDMRVLIPGYRQVLNSGYPIEVVATLEGHAALPSCQIGQMEMRDGLIVYVVLCDTLYDRTGNPYCDSSGRDWPDNHIRFARLALAAAQMAAGAPHLDWQPDLVHANDWPTGLTPCYMQLMGLNLPSIFTIHNLAYMGLFEQRCLCELGLPQRFANPEGFEYYGQLSFLKAGINYASHITTVSQSYAREITTPERGCGLEGVLRQKSHQALLSGIANGIDSDFDPSADHHLVSKFSYRNWKNRSDNARYLEQYFAIEQDSGPLFGIVSRLVQQKGIDLTLEVADHLVSKGGRLIVFGRGEPELEERVKALESRYPRRVGVHIDFNETVARRIFAGSDFLLMPSIYEPCGLSQMYAQCFGALPIAHRTGGLADTIEDGVTGILFDRPCAEAYRAALDRAFDIYADPPLIAAMRGKAMVAPNYWHQAVKPYVSLYQTLIHDKPEQYGSFEVIEECRL